MTCSLYQIGHPIGLYPCYTPSLSTRLKLKTSKIEAKIYGQSQNNLFYIITHWMSSQLFLQVFKNFQKIFGFPDPNRNRTETENVGSVIGLTEPIDILIAKCHKFWRANYKYNQVLSKKF